MGRMKRIFDRGFALLMALEVCLTYIFLYLPIVVLILYSFSASRYALVWGGFSLEPYTKLLSDPEALRALGNSFIVGIISMGFSTLLGTLLALGLERGRTWGRGGVETLAYLPIVLPEIVMGVGLLLFFAQVWRRLGGEIGPLPTVIAGHVAFSISYVMVVVRARLRDLDRSLEEAALDLGATPAQVWRRVTIPLLMPAIASGALLVFALSLDDFYVTYFSTTGGSGFKTLPLYLYALQGRAGLPPQMNALATLMLSASLLFVAFALISRRDLTPWPPSRRGKGDQAPPGQASLDVHLRRRSRRRRTVQTKSGRGGVGGEVGEGV